MKGEKSWDRKEEKGEKIEERKSKKKIEEDKKNNLGKQTLIGHRWSMFTWITSFLKENSDRLEKEKLEKERAINKQWEEWDGS